MPEYIPLYLIINDEDDKPGGFQNFNELIEYWKIEGRDLKGWVDYFEIEGDKSRKEVIVDYYDKKLKKLKVWYVDNNKERFVYWFNLQLDFES